MPEENEKLEKEGDGDTVEGKEKKDVVTLESLAETISGQAGMIKAMEEKNADEVANILKKVQSDNDLVAGDMKNLLNLLGGLANDKDKPTETEEIEQLSTKSGIEKLVDERVGKAKKEEKEQLTAEQNQYFKEYAEYTQVLLDEENGPDGKPLAKDARAGIMELLKTDILDIHSKSGTRDAVMNLRTASRRYFGLDKTHGFKGSSVEGTGQGGGKEPGEESGIKKRNYTDKTKDFFKQIGVTEDWADKKMAAREEVVI